jgi:hypothetical protein
MSLGDAIFGNHIDSAHTYDVNGNGYQYGGQAGGADAARNRLQGLGFDAQNRGEIAGDYSTAGQSRAGVMGALDMTRAAANGSVPSAAEGQMNKGTQDALRAGIAQQAGARGAGAMGAAGAQGAVNATNLQGQNIANTGILRANEQATARGQLLSGTQGLNAADIGQANAQAQNLIASRGQNDQTQLGFEGLGQNVDMAQLQAQQAEQAQRSQNENSAQDRNAQIGIANAQNNNSNANAGLGALSSAANTVAGWFTGSDARVKTGIRPLDGRDRQKPDSMLEYPHASSVVPDRTYSMQHESFPSDGPAEMKKDFLIPRTASDAIFSDRHAKTDMHPLTKMYAAALLDEHHDRRKADALMSSEDLKTDITPLQTWGGGQQLNPQIPRTMPGGMGMADPLGDQFPVERMPWEKGVNPGGHVAGGMMSDADLKAADARPGMTNMPSTAKGPELAKAPTAKEAVSRPALEHGGGDEKGKKSSYDIGRDTAGALLGAGKAIGGAAMSPSGGPEATPSDRRLKGNIEHLSRTGQELARGSTRTGSAGRIPIHLEDHGAQYSGYYAEPTHEMAGGPGAYPNDMSESFPSDKRLKTDMHPDPMVEDFLNSLHPYSFKYKDPSLDPTNRGTHYGVMAQDVNKTPMGHSLIDKMDGQGHMGIDIKRGLGAALAAEADLNQRVNALSKKKGA